MKRLFLFITLIAFLTSCTATKYNSNGCPKAKTTARHDKNLRF